MKVTQHKKVVARKGVVVAQSGQQPNKPNQTRIARRSRERKESAQIVEDPEQPGPPFAPQTSCTPDMDVHKIAKRYKKLKKSGEYKGGRTVIGISSFVLGQASNEELSQGHDQVHLDQR